MKKIALAGLACMAVVSPAFAADLPVKTPVHRASPPIVANWTGCYVGGNIGYGWAPTKWSGSGVEYASHTADGLVGGGQVGCDYQNGRWVLGIQGMFDASGMKGSSINWALDPAGGVTDTTQISWFATLTGRVGYTLQPMTLLYVKGGVAWVRSKFNECCEPTVIIQDTSGPFEDGYANVTRTGWTVGAGVEHMFRPHWSAFLEYNFIGLGNDGITFTPIPPAPSPFIYNIHQDIHLVLVGVNYRF
jgi:outer membrane immunogenic protein